MTKSLRFFHLGQNGVPSGFIAGQKKSPRRNSGAAIYNGKGVGSATPTKQADDPEGSNRNGAVTQSANAKLAGRSDVNVFIVAVRWIGIALIEGRAQSCRMALTDKIPWLAAAPRGERWLVGVSGGADSVALLHLLVRSGFRDLIVCHLDHRLRGRSSTEDAKFVHRLAGMLGLECEIGRCDVRSRMAGCKESMETAGRNARHDFFAGCAAKYGSNTVLLAHHADDQAETVLWNLLRGSHGLKGMRQEQRITVGETELHLIRPLLGVRRAELVAWLEAQDLRWREDASNLEPVAVRNRLRNEVFPLLAEISGRDVVPPLVRCAADAALREDCQADALDQAKLLDPQGRLHLAALRKLPPDLQLAGLRDFLVNAGIPSIDRALLERALGLVNPANPAAINLPGGKRLRRRAGRIWIDC